MAKARILLVEDSRAQALVTKEFLEDNGYDVDWVEDGKSAIRKARTGPVDVILLDVVLPDLNGNEVCRWLKLDQHTKGIPIIMITTKGETHDKVSGLDAGADDYLSKPYNEIELNARIYASLRTKALQDELREKNRQLEEMLEKVKLLAMTDPLTGLFNRRHCESVVESEFSRTVRYQSPLACLMIDIDHFKKVNDYYGHRMGDQILTEVAGMIKAGVRAVDTVARWGGEEFMVILSETGREGALRFAERLLERISDHAFSDNPDIKITVSIGMASIPDLSIDTAEKLVDSSDFALYEAKRKGRNRIESSWGKDTP